MARQAKQQQQQVSETVRVVYPRDGAVEELRGRAFAVPSTVTAKAGWIESQWREEQARKAAAAEAEQRNATVLSDRIEQQRVADSQALQMAEANAAEAASLRAQVVELQQQLAMPDASRFAEIANGTTAAMGRTFDLQQQVAALSEQTEALALRTQEMADACAAQADSNQAVLRNAQELMNGSFGSYGSALQRFQGELTEQEVRISELASKTADNWEVVEKAGRISESAKEIARQEANELITRQLTEFRVFLSVALNAIGVNQRDIDDALNRMDEGLQRGMFVLDQGYIAQAVRIAQKFQAAKDDAEYRTDLASAQSAGRLGLSGDVYRLR